LKSADTAPDLVEMIVRDLGAQEVEALKVTRLL